MADLMAFALKALLSLSPGALVVIGIVVFYEGLPTGPLRKVPVLGPLVGELTDGRVDRAFAQGRREAEVEGLRQAAQMNDRLDRERRQNQTRVDEIEREYFDASVGDRLKIVELEDALSKEQENADPVCRAQPAVSRRLRDVLAPIGRR